MKILTNFIGSNLVMAKFIIILKYLSANWLWINMVSWVCFIQYLLFCDAFSLILIKKIGAEICYYWFYINLLLLILSNVVGGSV